MNTRQVVNDLAEYRRRKHIMQVTIAQRMGVSTAAVTMLETRKNQNPKWASVIRYARALGVRLHNLPEEASE